MNEVEATGEITHSHDWANYEKNNGNSHGHEGQKYEILDLTEYFADIDRNLP